MCTFMNMQEKKPSAVRVNRAGTTRTSYAPDLSDVGECSISFTQNSASFTAVPEDSKSSSATCDSRISASEFSTCKPEPRKSHYQVTKSETFDYYATARRINKVANISRD